MTRLDHNEVDVIVSRILSDKLTGTGYQRAETQEDKDYDGDPIIRVRVYFDHPMNDSKPLLESTHAIREELLRQGDDRYVFISPKDNTDADAGLDGDGDV